MTHVTRAPKRFDPYRNFKFRVKWDGRYVAGVSKISALKRTTEAVDYREGGESNRVQKIPGRTRFEPITLERGISHDSEFEQWANLVSSLTFHDGNAPTNFRKDGTIDIF